MAEHDELCAELLVYAQTKACVHAADDEVYLRFLEKQAAHQNGVARGQLASVARVAGMQGRIMEDIEQLRICGLWKLHAVCTLVCEQRSSVFSTHHRWAICSVSGFPTNECVVLGTAPEWAVDVSFLHFLRQLWIVTHIDHIEQSKFAHFVASRPTHEKTIDVLKNLQASETYTSAAQLERYACAFENVLATLKLTAEQYVARLRADMLTAPPPDASGGAGPGAY